MPMGLKLGLNIGRGGSGGPAVPTVNLITYSQQMSNGLGWAVGNCTVVVDSVVAPDATTTAEMFTSTTTAPTDTHVSTAVSVGLVYTASVYVPAGGDALFAFLQMNATAGGAAFFTVNRSTGAVSWTVTGAGTGRLVAGQDLSGIASVSDGAGGWRIYATFTAQMATQSFIAGFSETSGSRTSVIGKTCPLWQAQLVLGTDPGPIILRVA